MAKKVGRIPFWGGGGGYLDELGVILSVGGSAAFARCRIFPVEIEAVELMLAEILDGRSHQILAGLRIGHQFGEPSRSFVPSADGQQSLQVLVVGLETVEFGVAPFN